MTEDTGRCASRRSAALRAERPKQSPADRESEALALIERLRWIADDDHPYAEIIGAAANEIEYWLSATARAANIAFNIAEGSDAALAAGSRRAKTPRAVECEASQSGGSESERNAQKEAP